MLVIGNESEVTTDEVSAPLLGALLKVAKVQAPKFAKALKAEDFTLQLGCEFSPDATTLTFNASGETNPKMIVGETRVVAELTATFDPATHNLTVKTGKVTEAKTMKDE